VSQPVDSASSIARSSSSSSRTVIPHYLVEYSADQIGGRQSKISKSRRFCFKECFDPFVRDLGDDRVSVGAQSSHAAGSPISQRECAGFNWPPFSILAGDPIRARPRPELNPCFAW